MFKTNVLGSLRTARAFTGLLKPTRGRLIYFGAGNEGEGLVAYTASRLAVDGCVDALRTELHPFGISVIGLDSHGVPAESLYRSPIPFRKFFGNLYKTSNQLTVLISDVTDQSGAPTQYSAEVLTHRALGVIENALWDVCPNERYHLAVPYSKYSITKQCRSMYKKSNRVQTVQKV